MNLSLVKFHDDNIGLHTAVFADPTQAERYAANWILTAAQMDEVDVGDLWQQYHLGQYQAVLDFNTASGLVTLGVEHDVPVRVWADDPFTLATAGEGGAR